MCGKSPTATLLPVMVMLNSPDVVPFDPEQDVNVLVAYDDPAAADGATSLLERVGRRSHLPGRLIYTMWRFSVLSVTALRKLAASEAAAADLIVIATQEGRELPEQIKDWISLWLSERKDHPGALVAVLRPAADGQDTHPVHSRLEDIARIGGMDFFAGGGGDDAEMDQALARGTPAAAARQSR